MPEVPVDITRMTDAFGDDFEFLNEIYTTFLEDSAERLKSLVDIVNSQDVAQCADVAHAIKGSSANVGADTMQQIAATMEKNARAADLTDAQAHLDSLNAEFAKAKAYLVEYLNSIKS